MERLTHIPRKLSEKILRKLNEGKSFVISPGKKDPKRARVFDFEKYVNKKAVMKEMAKQYKPWEARWPKKQKSKLGPIGSKPLGDHGRLSRSEIYEGI